MKIRWIAAVTLLLLVGALPVQAHAGWAILNWMEGPPSKEASATESAEDQAEFLHVLAFDPYRHDEASWQPIKETLTEGHIIAYREDTWKTQLEIFLLARLNKIPYTLFKYGHMAMVVKDPDDQSRLRLLSSWSLRGPNIGEDLDSLRNHSWDAYRLNHWDRVNKTRLYEFIRLVRAKAEKWYGYDFSAMFGLWNSNLQPREPDDIGRDYICSTVVLAALHYAGVELDAYHRRGIADIVTPLQVIRSKGKIVSAPAVNDELFGNVIIAAENEDADDRGTKDPGEEG